MKNKNKLYSYAKSILAIENSLGKSDFDDALNELDGLITSVMRREGSDMQIIPTPDIDSLFKTMAQAIALSGNLEESPTKERTCDVLFISSELYKTGGHTREIEDWCRSLAPECRVALLVSKPSTDADFGIRLHDGSNVTTYRCNSQTAMERVSWIRSVILELRPKSVMVSPSANDSALFVALCLSHFDGKVFLNLNLDHNVSPGLGLEVIDHVVVRRIYLLQLLRREYGVKNAVYIPFSRSGQTNVKNHTPTFKNGPATFSCTSSSAKIASSYGYPFCDVIPEMIIKCGLTHVHVGAISESSVSKIQAKLLEVDMSDRFIHITHAENLATVFKEYGVNILIQTFPIGGGLVAIEAMRSGLAIVNHKCYRTRQFFAADFTYPGAFSWSRPEELFRLVSLMDEDQFARHHSDSLAYYETFNKMGKVERVLKDHVIENTPFDEEYFEELYRYPLDHFRIQSTAPLKQKDRIGFLDKLKKELRRLYERM